MLPISITGAGTRAPGRQPHTACICTARHHLSHLSPHAPTAGIYEWFNIAFDKFGRTPSRWQTHICQSIFADLDAAGQLVEQSMEQLYSEALGKFLADRWEARAGATAAPV